MVPAMAALSTCVSDGLMPQARHGGKGVCALAEVGSKFDGTGLEKLHIVHTQVAEETFGRSGAEREGLSPPAAPLREPRSTLDVPRVRPAGRRDGLGISVTLGDERMKPA